MLKMEFKYKSDLTIVEETKKCICFENANEISLIAYRWVFSDNDTRNFEPTAKRPENLSHQRKCEGWALSFYDTKDNSKSAWEKIISNRKDAYMKIGTHIAEVQIEETNGKADDVRVLDGHFNLLEYEDSNFEGKFSVIFDLINKVEFNTLTNGI